MKYKSTLARGLSHAWPWTKPIGSSPTSSRLLRYSLLCMLVLLGSGSMWADDATLAVDFEKETTSYTDWTFTNFATKQTNSGVAAHGGSYFGSTGGKTSGSLVTKEKLAKPKNIQFYISKTSTNSSASSWIIKVSTDGETWTNVKTQSASAVTKGTWTEVTQDLTSYTNVYVGIFYDGTTAIRTIDDVTLTYENVNDTRTATTIALADGYATTGVEGKTVDMPTATVMAGETAVTGAEVTWKSSDESVAKIEGNKISLLSPGTATITATYAGDDSYKSSKATYDLTVTELSVDGLASMAIIFKDSGSNSDSGTKITSIDDIISEGNNYVSSIPTADNVYNGRTDRGLKLGASSKSATLILTLAKAVKPIKITFDAMKYNDTETSITVNGKAITNLGSELATYSVIYDGETEVSSIEISTPSKRAYITNVKIYYEPEATPAPLYILGVNDANENDAWDIPDEFVEMTWDTENEAYTYELNNTSTASFCFSTNNEVSDWNTFNSTYRWAIDEGDSDFPQHLVGVPLTLLKVNGTIKLPAGTWTISIAPDDTSGEMGMTITGEATPVEEHTYIVAGSEPEIFGTSWDGTYEANKMTKQTDGTYQKTYTVDQAYKGVQLKVVKDGSDWIGGDTGDNVSFNLTGAGNFTVSIEPTTSKVTVTGDIVSFALDYESVYAVGDGLGTLTDWSFADGNKLTESAETPGVYTITFNNVPASEAVFKFALDGEWTHNFGGTTDNGNPFAATLGTEYDAVYNGENITITTTETSNITLKLDLSNFNYATKQGAKFTITSEAVKEPGFRDIKLDLTQHSEVLTGSDVLITVAEDGTIGTTDNEEEAAAAVCGNVHNSYGSSNFTAIVPVEGTVKITYATHDYGNVITVTDDNGNEVAKLNTQGAKWMNDHANVVVAYYRTNEPTTLHFSNANYNPYFAVEAIDPADIPAEVTKYTVTFAAGDGVQGVAPAAIEVEAGSETTAPRNTSLYKEGYTLIGWESGNEVILPGAKFTPETDMELTAKFGVNEVSLADREEDVTITYVLDGYNDAPKYNFQSGDGIIVTQATVNEKTIDVAVNTNGMFANNNSGWTLLNKDTKVTVPSCKGATIKVTTYQNANALNFGETAAEPNANPATYTATAEDETLVITQTAQGYWSKLEITLPKVESTEPGGDDVSGVFFSADVIATEVQNFATGTTEITSAQATIVGGKMYAISAQETEKALINKQNNIYYFSITNNNTYFKVELDHALAVGDVITADGNGGVKNGSNKGLWVSTSDSYPSAAPACAGTSETESIITNLLNYTIQEGDEYVGKTTLYIYRAAGATEYFGNLKITRPASDEPSETNLKEKAIIDTDFQDWAKSSETTMVTTKYTKENITFTYSNATVDPEATNEGKFPTTTDAAYKGYIMSAKSEATITTTTFASISKIRYRHGATGNNRGWGLKMKVGDGEWEIVSDATVGSTPAWIEKTIDKENVQLQWYNLNTTQNAYMFELEVYAKVDLSNSPLLATLKANGTTYTAEDIFEMGTDDNYAATIELASSEAMPSAENPVEAVADNGEIGNITYETSNDQSVVTIPVTAGEASVNYVATFVRKPNFTLTYYNLDGEEIGTQQVEKDAKIGEFAYDIANVAASKEGYKARGWFKNNYVGEKWTTESVITADAKLYAVETEIEVSSDSKRYEFDLTDKNFDAADHEAFNPTGNGKWHDNQHGWAFADGDKLELLVGGKASIILGLCQYSADVKISASNDESVDAKVETDGTTATIEYEGEPGTLTLTFNGTTYLHKLTIFNTTTTNYEQDGEWIIVKEGDGSSLVDALFAAKEGTKIFLPNGTYDLGQKTLTTIGNNNVSIIGESMEGVIIKNRPTTEGIAVTATLLNTSTGLYMQDLTLDCVAPWSGSAERGVTLQDKGNQTILKNVYLKGLQDTYYSNNQNGTYYFEDGKIEGSVDYVCGNGDVYFNKTTFYTVNKSTGAVGGCIAAPNTLNSFGYIFNECTLDGAANEDGKYRLGRPWAANTKCLFVNTTMKIKPVAEGWGDWSPANPVKQFAEYNSKDAEGNVISLDGRKTLFNGVENNPVLTETEAEALAPDVIFNGEWKPQVIAQQVEAPVAELKDGVITWEKVNGATAYALFNNGSLMAIVDGETTSYTIEDAESGQGAPALLRGGEDSSTAYTIRAANGRGGFGVPKGVTLATGIQQISKELGADVKIYDLNGRRVMTPTTGVYIINGKKVVIK